MSTRTKLLTRAACVDQSADQFAGELLVHVHAHVRELEADVAFRPSRDDLVDHLVIERGAFLRLVDVGDVLAQVVDGDRQAEIVQCAVAAIASSTVVPATKRLDVRCPMEERSATARSVRLSESQTKNALSIPVACPGAGSLWDRP